MAVPRTRQSNSRKNIRRSHDAKKPKTLSVCVNCGEKHQPHCVCAACGTYKGRNLRKD